MSLQNSCPIQVAQAHCQDLMSVDLFLPFLSVSGHVTLGWPTALTFGVKVYREDKTLAQPCLRRRSNMGGQERTLGTENNGLLIFRVCLSLPTSAPSLHSQRTPTDHSLVQISPGLCLWASVPAGPALATTLPHISTRKIPPIHLA